MSKTKTFLAGLYVAVIYIIVILYMVSCNSPHRDSMPKKKATLVVNHSDKDIIIETLHSGNIDKGIYKVLIDSSEYIIISKETSQGTSVAITKHN